MKEFSFKTRVFFGEGALDRLSKLHDKNVLIVTDRFISGIGLPALIESKLTNCNTAVFDGVVPNPPIEVIAAGIKALADCNANSMIAVGGGSTIDAAKGIKAVAKDALGVDTDKWECFAIPTTSGTGSEVTDYAVISDNQAGVKYPLASRKLEPPTAILDPELTVSVPPAITADTGMDALTHALEAYISTDSNEFSDAFCEKAIRMIFTFLPVAYEDGKNRYAREKMHIASCMAGLAFNSAGLGLNHGMAHAIGAKLHISHGRSNAILLPYIMNFNAALDEAKDGNYSITAMKLCSIAKLLGMPASSIEEGVISLISGIVRLNLTMKLPTTLREHGVEPDQLEKLRKEIVEAALADATTATNPRKVTAAQIDALLTKVMG